MNDIVKFDIEGLFGSYNVSIPVKNRAIILVGPNGIGKTTVLTIIYYFITMQWKKLTDFDFVSISITYDDQKYYKVTKDGVEKYLASVEQVKSLPPRLRRYLEILRDRGLYEAFLAKQVGSAELTEFSRLLGTSVGDVQNLRSFLRRNLPRDLDLFSGASEVFSAKQVIIPAKVLYLPTYRRIEKDISAVFPHFEEDLRARLNRDLIAGRKGNHFIELISFGMEDVSAQIKDTLGKLREESITELNNLAGRYLRDVINGQADRHNRAFLISLTDADISTILDRVEEENLSSAEKGKLKEAIKAIQTRKTGRMVAREKYMAYYFSKLVEAGRFLKIKDKKVQEFVDVCNVYFGKNKKFQYDDVKYTIDLLRRDGEPVELSELSSGEKQIVSVFSHLYMGEHPSYAVMIDEPELSLSVVWQRKFLPNILESSHCSLIFAVTHSPFIYDNDLKSSCHDLRKLMTQVA